MAVFASDLKVGFRILRENLKASDSEYPNIDVGLKVGYRILEIFEFGIDGRN